MLISNKELVSRVRVLLNEDAHDAGMEDMPESGRLTLDKIIYAVLDEEITRVLEKTCFTGSDDLRDFGGSVQFEEPGVGRIEPPPDFMKLVEMRLSSWKRSVTALCRPGDPGYWRRGSPSGIVRGTHSDPRIYAVTDGKKTGMELHPFQSGDTLVCGRYVPIPTPTTEGDRFIPAQCLTEAVASVAEHVMKILRGAL